MGAIEPARQAGSTDTDLNHELDHDGFAVGSLAQSLGPRLSTALGSQSETSSALFSIA